MITDWKSICTRVAEKLNIPEEEVIEEIQTYYGIARKLVKGQLDTPVKVDLDLLIGKMKPKNRDIKTVKERNPPSEWFHKFYPVWKEVIEKGRGKIKGTFNPFENDKKLPNKLGNNNK